MNSERTQDYTTLDLAQAAGVTDRYIRQLVTSGKLTGTKYGNTWVIPAEVGAAWLQERKAKQDKT